MLRLRRAAYRVAYRVLWLAAFVVAPRGRGAKAVLVHDGRVLLVRHTYGPDRWELPGGGVRRREDPADALGRELEEELGVSAAGATALAVLAGPGRFRHHSTHIYRLDLDSPVVRADPVEIEEARWCEPDSPPGRLGWMTREAFALAGPAGPRDASRSAQSAAHGNGTR